MASKAVKVAQKKSLENGVANVYSKNSQIYFQLPNGTSNNFDEFEVVKSFLVGV